MKLSDRLREQYPEEMTIVLQHQFWDLKVTDELFEVGLVVRRRAGAAGGSVRRDQEFADPSVQFTLQFETLAEAGDDAEGDDEPERRAKRRSRDQAQSKPPQARRPAAKTADREPGRTSVPASPLPASRKHRDGRAASLAHDRPADKSGGAEVVRLDRFRKK